MTCCRVSRPPWKPIRDGDRPLSPGLEENWLQPHQFWHATADRRAGVAGRIHDFYDVIQAVKWARQAGFAQINLDLIFGLPFQTLETWQTSVEAALRLDPEHLSLYALTVEHGTPLFRWVGRAWCFAGWGPGGGHVRMGHGKTG